MKCSKDLISTQSPNSQQGRIQHEHLVLGPFKRKTVRLAETAVTIQSKKDCLSLKEHLSAEETQRHTQMFTAKAGIILKYLGKTGKMWNKDSSTHKLQNKQFLIRKKEKYLYMLHFQISSKINKSFVHMKLNYER